MVLRYCDRWTCPHCSPQKQEDVIEAAVLQFSPLRTEAGTNIACSTIREGHSNFNQAWQRFRNRITGCTYLAVTQRNPYRHIHLMIAGIAPDDLQIQLDKSRLIAEYVKPVDSVRKYAAYIMQLRGKGFSRISHSRDFTNTLESVRNGRDPSITRIALADKIHKDRNRVPDPEPYREYDIKAGVRLPGVDISAEYHQKPQDRPFFTMDPDTGAGRFDAAHILLEQLQSILPADQFTVGISITPKELTCKTEIQSP